MKTGLYVSVGTLSTQDNTKLPQQLNSECKRTITEQISNKELKSRPKPEFRLPG